MRTNHEILTQLEKDGNYDNLSANPNDWMIVKAMDEVRKEITEYFQGLQSGQAAQYKPHNLSRVEKDLL